MAQEGPKTPAVGGGPSQPRTGVSSDDPYCIGSRYIPKQARVFPQALKEIKNGRKSSHWMWYVIPTPPYVVNGEERASGTNSEYALRDLPPNTLTGFDAARAYLQFPEKDGVNLRKNYVDIITAVGDQVERGVSLTALMGFLDDPKLRSSVRLFEFVSRDDSELKDVHAACMRVLKLLREEPMAPTGNRRAGAVRPVVDAESEETAAEARKPAEGAKDSSEAAAGENLSSEPADGTEAAVAARMEQLMQQQLKQGDEL